MQPYHISIHGDAVITVEVGDTPITLHVTTKGGKSVTFQYEGGTGRRAYATRGSRTPEAVPAVFTARSSAHTATPLPTGITPPAAGTPLTRMSLTDGGDSIEYIDPRGSGM